MVQDDVSYGIPSKGVIAVSYIDRSAAEAHVSDDDVVRINEK